MKYVTPLSDFEWLTLKEMYKNAPIHRLRQRAHILLMSHQKMQIKEIALAVGLDRDTISSTFDAWTNRGLGALYDNQRSGRPKIFNESDEALILLKLSANPRCLKALAADIEKMTGKRASTETIKRIIKKKDFRWKRIKKKVAGKPTAEEYELKKKALNALKQRSFMGEIDLFFVDESGFSLVPTVPYAWQPRGKTIEVRSSRSQRINVLGFLSDSNELKAMTLNGSMDTNCIIAAIDNIFRVVDQETWFVMDNAPIHRSLKFKEKILEWKKRHLHILFLPPYSPELNVIEILWRFIKYQWIPFSAYTSFKDLTASLNDILANYGEKHSITFA